MQAFDSKIAAEGKEPLYQRFPRPQLVHMSVISTLGYCAFYHFNAPPDALSSPTRFKQTFKVRCAQLDSPARDGVAPLTDTRMCAHPPPQIDERAYTFVALQMRARLKDWNSLPQLLKTSVRPRAAPFRKLRGVVLMAGFGPAIMQSSFFMGNTVKSPIGFEPFVRETYRNNAPPEVLGTQPPARPPAPLSVRAYVHPTMALSQRISSS